MNLSDLSTDGLARLEAKLLADLEVVRRMRSLLEEHRAVWENRPAGTPAPAPAAPASPPVPAASPEEIAEEWLRSMPGDTFETSGLRKALARKGTRLRDNNFKTLMNRLLRTGKIAVQTARTGRAGSIYRRTMPAAPVSGSAAPVSALGDSVSPPDTPLSPPDKSDSTPA